MTTSPPRFFARLFAVLLAFVLLFHSSARAQFGTGTVNGNIVDASGSSVPNASITIVNLGTNATFATTSNGTGQYAKTELPIGKYRITVNATGFGAETKQGIEVSVGAQLTIDFQLTVGGVETTVNVTSSAQAEVNSTSGQQELLVDQRQMRELPLNGRNFEQLILLAQGAHSSPATTSTSFYGRSPAYSISGARPQGQLVLLDGANIQGYFNRGTGASIIGTSLGVEAIAEFQTIVGVYGANFGGNGSVINAVTKSGTNEIHGSAYDFVRNSAFDARNYFDGPTGPPSFRRNQFGASIGLPIRKDQTFFFMNYEGLRQQLAETNITNVPDQNAHNGLLPCALATTFTCVPATGLAFVGVSPTIAPYLALLPLPNAGLNAGAGTGQYRGVANNPANEDYFHARLDQVLSKSDSFSARYVSDNGVLVEPFPTLTLSGFPEVSIQRNRFATVEDKHIFSPAILDTVRFHFTRTSAGARQQGQDPAYSVFQFVPGRQYGSYVISSLNPSGRPSNGFGSYPQTPFSFVQDKFDFQNSLYLSIKTHQIQAGIDIVRVQSNGFVDYFAAANYTFPALTNYLAAKPTLVSVALAGSNSHRDGRELDISPYIQDDWKVTSKLSINLGVRYEFVTNPVDKFGRFQSILNPQSSTGFTSVEHAFGSNPSVTNVDPRFGFAYAPFGPKTAIRGGFGIFHEPIAARSYLNSYILSSPYSLRAIANPSFPNPLASTNLGLPSLSAALPYTGVSTPYQMQSSLNIEQQLTKNMLLSVAYVGNEGRHLYLEQDLNPPVAQTCPCSDALNASAASLPAGTTYFPSPVASAYKRINSSFGALTYNPTSGTSHYHSLQTSLSQQLARGLQFQISYTWSKILDYGSLAFGTESSNGSNAEQNPYNVRQDYGPAAFDIRHVGTGNLLYQVPNVTHSFLLHGWEATMIAQLRTGSPYNAILGFDRVNLNNNLTNERPNIVGDPNRPGAVAGNPTCSAPSIIHNATTWYNPCAFQLQPAGTIGTERRDQIYAAGLKDFDVALIKDTAVPKFGENFHVELRGELFNFANHTNLGLPNFTVITAASGLVNTAAGQILKTTNTSRQAQFAVKFLF